MEEETKPIEDEKPIEGLKSPKKVKDKKKLIRTVLLILLIIVFAGASAAATYWWRDRVANDSKGKQDVRIASLEKEKTSLKKQLAVAKASNTTAADQSTCTSKSPTVSVIESIKASITSGNTAALEGYMASSVNVILAASEGIGPSTPAQAVSSISSFITSDINSWAYDFSLPAAILSSYGSGGYSQYFPNNAVVGKAANGKVISFSFDCNAKISTVFLASSEELLQ